MIGLELQEVEAEENSSDLASTNRWTNTLNLPLFPLKFDLSFFTQLLF